MDGAQHICAAQLSGLRTIRRDERTAVRSILCLSGSKVHCAIAFVIKGTFKVDPTVLVGTSPRGGFFIFVRIFSPVSMLLHRGLRRLSATPAARARALNSSAPPTVRPLHLLLYQYVDDAVEKRQPYRANHLGHARASIDRGELLLGGALANPVDGGVLIFTAGAAAERFAETDPYVLNGIVTSWTVREWSVVVGSLKVPPVAPFVPSYEWQRVEPGCPPLPAGLDVEMPLDGGHQRARIPQLWQLSVFVDKGYLRHQVTRKTTISDLRAVAARHMGVPLERIFLAMGAKQLNDGDTVESVGLFGREAELRVVVRDGGVKT